MKNPVTGVHTNIIKGTWYAMKRGVPERKWLFEATSLRRTTRSVSPERHERRDDTTIGLSSIREAEQGLEASSLFVIE